jgi:hypothetical protein
LGKTVNNIEIKEIWKILKFSSKKDNGRNGSKKHNNLKRTSDDIESGDKMEITM